jgi:hypothetical protein
MNRKPELKKKNKAERIEDRGTRRWGRMVIEKQKERKTLKY